MKSKPVLIGIAAAVALAAAGYGPYQIGVQRGLQRGMSHSGASSAGGAAKIPQGIAEGEAATRRHIAQGLKAGDIDPATGTKILYYQDPMAPAQKFDKPAKSPFMDMMLVPVYAGAPGESGDASDVTVSPRIQQTLGLRTAPVVEGELALRVAAVGNIAYNERDQVVVQTRANAFIEKLFVRATLDRVAAGQPLAELYVPEWVSAQEEFLSIRRMQGTELAPLIDGARQRMRQVGMSDTQIAAVEASGQIRPRFTLTAPIAGVIVELMAREGMTMMAGGTIARINGLATVWANAEVPESQAALLRAGTRVQARSPAVPGAVFEGRVQAILPEVDPATRTLKARVELANPGARLVPGHFVQMSFADTRAGKALLVPSEAIIQTGKRAVVMLAEDNGRFRAVEVEVGAESGAESGGQTEIKRGLAAGQQVVVSSQFLIDSEASLRGVETRLNAQAPAAATAKHAGDMTVEHIAADSITLTHGPIASLKWPAMTMEFRPPATGWPADIRAGARVRVEFMQEVDGPRITAVTRLPQTPPSPKSPPDHSAHGSGK
jgi:Cu(I)/Ag(I) efflux system membrane fusion protein